MTHRGAATKSRGMPGRTARAVVVVLAMLAGVVGAAGALSPAAEAAQSLFASTLNNEVSLVSNVDGVAPGQPVRIGLLFGLGAGWHIYWTNPGDAGAAPTMTVSLPQGGTAGAIQWPIPKVMNDGPVTSYGYTGKTGPVLLPLTITPPKTLPIASRYKVSVAVTWLVCKEICVPGDATFTLTLPVAAKPVPSAEAPLFAAVDRNSPAPEHWRAWVEPDGALTVDGTGATRGGVDSAYFFPLQSGEINPDYYQPLKIDRGRITLGLKPDSGFDAHHPLAGLLALTAPDGRETAAMISAQPGIPPAAAPAGSALATALASVTSAGFLALVGAALLGGLILNLMPASSRCSP